MGFEFLREGDPTLTQTKVLQDISVATTPEKGNGWLIHNPTC